MKLDVKTCLRAGVTIFLLYLCIHYWPSVARMGSLLLSAAMPLLLGAVMAYLVNILMTFYEHRLFGRAASGAGLKLKRPLCMALAFATLLIIVVLLLVLVIPELVSCICVIAAGVPGVVADFTKWCEEQGILPETIADSLAQIDWKSRMTDIVKVLTAGVGSAANAIVNTVTSVVSGFVTFFMALIFSIYLLLGKEKLGRQLQKIMERYLRDGWNKKIRYVVGVVNDCFHRYIVGQCTEAVILGVLCMLGMLLIRLPYATMIGALIGFTALIPVAGAYIGAIVGAFMILTVSPVKALIFLVFIVILQQLEGNLIYPKVVGSSLGLPALWVLAAVTVGGGVLGIPGMLLGVPLSAAVYRLIRNDVYGTEEKAEKQEAE
ncbi:AI-2E family transporter [Lachnoclostridium sp. An131]|uniref:AI-2E family transporter n=1 Tax=Lachnoclostridium sp. An131 TaxID=1965555 RepID=UPI000B36AEBB|nr:AI-2E family transporter [Lachnoclostridium sp. An131]OUQ23621.1 AI-2E family transporter [Lachnoclostridium sp. An131]